MKNDYILDIRRLNTGFVSDKKHVRILKDVSFRMRRRQTLAIVGESGCGKSVTVHSIARLLPPNAHTSAEQIVYRSTKGGQASEYHLERYEPYGRQMRSLRGAEIGMIFQSPMTSLNPVYTIGSQITEGLREHEKLSRQAAMERAVDMLRQLGIPAPEQRVLDYPHQLSGGMKQRAMIAIAMINNPELLIADEPTTALDVTIQAQIMELMKRLQVEMGKSIILITHNMGLVAEMADEVCVMYMGRIVEMGSVEDIFDRPAHPYTQALLSSVPVLGMAKDQQLVTISGFTPNPADLGDGCEFAGRCPSRMDACCQGEIPSYGIAPGHTARCLRYAGQKEVE